MIRKSVFLMAIATMTIACNNDDNGDNPGTSVGNYLPLTEGNYWTYDVEGQEYMGRDSVYVANDTAISGSEYKKMKARPISVGLFAGTTGNNGIKKEGGKIMMSGNAAIGIVDMLPLDLNISNFILLDENASAGQLMSSVSGVSEQEIDGLPLKLSYTLKSTAGSTMATYSAPNGMLYDNVKMVTMTLNLEISGTNNDFGFPIEFQILAAQDVITSQRYYADNIGMIYSETEISYELQDFSQFDLDLPIPQSDTQIRVETLNSYEVD